MESRHTRMEFTRFLSVIFCVEVFVALCTLDPSGYLDEVWFC